MGPEQEIAQALGVVVGRGFRMGLYRELTDSLAAGLNEGTYPVLSAIERAGAPVTAAAIAPEVGLDRSVVSRRASTLVAAGLIAPLPHPEDSRQVLLTLTESGAQAIGQARARLDHTIGRHIAGWTTTDRQRFAELFARFAAEPLRPRADRSAGDPVADITPHHEHSERPRTETAAVPGIEV